MVRDVLLKYCSLSLVHKSRIEWTFMKLKWIFFFTLMVAFVILVLQFAVLVTVLKYLCKLAPDGGERASGLLCFKALLWRKRDLSCFHTCTPGNFLENQEILPLRPSWVEQSGKMWRRKMLQKSKMEDRVTVKSYFYRDSNLLSDWKFSGCRRLSEKVKTLCLKSGLDLCVRAMLYLSFVFILYTFILLQYSAEWLIFHDFSSACLCKRNLMDKTQQYWELVNKK